jgi:FKBP-type peptidyl-prolyl cis-trans isomerase 2
VNAFSGAMCEVNEDDALFDFNHHLTSSPMKFEEKIVAYDERYRKLLRILCGACVARFDG